MAGYVVDIERKTMENENYRQVLFTGPHQQLVVMVLRTGEEIGMERLADFLNTSRTDPLRLYTLYAPPEHPDGTVNRTKAEAQEYERLQHERA